MYHGKQQADAAASFQRESEVLGQAGYRPTTQSWGQGQWGCGAWLVALALCILLIGILVFLYMVIVHPDGTLTVTYAKSAMAPVADVTAAIPFAPTQAPSAALTLSERLTQLDEARAAGLLTPEEYEAKRAALLESL